jgi:hypothetical protein
MNSSGSSVLVLVALAPVATAILDAERDAGLVERDQPAVGDGDAVGMDGTFGFAPQASSSGMVLRFW